MNTNSQYKYSLFCSLYILILIIYCILSSPMYDIKYIKHIWAHIYQTCKK